MVEEFCRGGMIAENNPLSFAIFRRGTFSKTFGGDRRAIDRGMVLNGEEEASFTFHTTGGGSERRLGKSVCQRRWQ